MIEKNSHHAQKVLLIGASGFIGQHTLKRLQQDGHDVTPIGGTPRIYSVPSDSGGWRDLIATSGPYDICINCAGRAHVGQSLSDPLQDFAGNTQLVFWLLDAIRLSCPECKFLTISSAAVYGTPSQLPIKESSPINPLSPYGWHKRLSEQICSEFAICYRLKTCSIRGFSVYGPGLKKQLFWDLAKRFTQESGTITLHGTGHETRDFIYIDDFCNAIFCILRHSPFEGESVNVASGQQLTIADAAKAFLTAFKHEGNLIFSEQLRPGDPTHWKADISLLQSYGFNPATAFEDGIIRTANWSKTLLSQQKQ